MVALFQSVHCLRYAPCLRAAFDRQFWILQIQNQIPFKHFLQKAYLTEATYVNRHIQSLESLIQHRYAISPVPSVGPPFLV